MSLTPTKGLLVLAAHHDGRGASFADRMLPRDPQTGFPRGAAEELATQSAKLSKTVGFTVVPAERMVNLAGRTAGSPNGRSRRRSRSSRCMR